MASLTTQAQSDDNKSDLASSVEDAQLALTDMTQRIQALADFSIDTNFDFSPQELGISFRSRATTTGFTNFNSNRDLVENAVDGQGHIAYSTIGAQGRFTPVNHVSQGDIPAVNESGIPPPAEASIDTTPPEAPVLAVVDPVTVNTGTAPGVGPVITDPDEVDAPIGVAPPVPVLTGVIIPELYDPSIPFFTEAVPVVPDSFAAPPADTFTFDGGSVDYSDTELTALQVVLLDDLLNGGYGVFHTDEESIFGREADREISVAQAAEEEIFDSFAARGFPIPVGAQIDMLAKLQQQTLNKISSINRDIAIQRSDLVRDSRALAFSTTAGLTGSLSTYRGFAFERLLKSQQFAASYAIQAMEAQIQIYNLQIQIFNAHALEFRTVMEGEIAQLERNKVVLDKARVQQTINDSEIALYNAQHQALAIEAAIYNTKVSAAKTKADIQVTKLDRYKLEFQIYVAELSAESTKVSNYVAQVGANTADVRLFATEVGAYGAKVEAQKTQESIYLARFDADVKRKELEFTEYEAKITLLTTELKQEADSIDFLIRKYTSDSISLNAFTRSNSSSLDALKIEQEFISDEADRDLKWLAENEIIKQRALDHKVETEIKLLEVRIKSLSDIMNALSASISHTDIVLST